MKKILALLLAMLFAVSFVACKAVSNGEETGADESGVKTYEKLAGKTPLELYTAAKEYVSKLENYEMLMDAFSEVEVNDTKNQMTTKMITKVDGTNMYNSYSEDNSSEQEQWYVGGYLFYNSGNSKEKIAMTGEEFSQNVGFPHQSSFLYELQASDFEGVLFEEKDGLFVLNFEISAEDYKSQSGTELSSPAKYVVCFDEKGILQSISMTLNQLVNGLYKVNSTSKVTISNVGSTQIISAPEDADEYVIPQKLENIDFSKIESLDAVSPSSEATDYVMIDVEGHGKIVIRLYPDVAPRTVENFKKLVAKGFYNGLTFHRVIENFMIQGGCPKGDGTGGADEDIKGEFTSNGITNNLTHKRGVVSMARSNDPDSASSQFFIVHADSLHLDGSYAAFGYVVYGMDTVDSIAKVETDTKDKPITSVIINSISFVKISE